MLFDAYDIQELLRVGRLVNPPLVLQDTCRICGQHLEHPKELSDVVSHFYHDMHTMCGDAENERIDAEHEVEHEAALLAEADEIMNAEEPEELRQRIANALRDREED